MDMAVDQAVIAAEGNGRKVHSAMLHEVMTVNEEIKEIVGIAHAIRLEATNAVLVAKRAGSRALGFGVVAHEIRTFSNRVMKHMSELQQMIGGLSGAAAKSETELHMQELFMQAAIIQRDAQIRYEHMDGLLGQLRERQLQTEATIRSERGRLNRLACLAWKDCDIGRSLARNAMIEAVSGGSMAGSLMQVARQVEDTVKHIEDVLGELKKHWS